MIVKLSNTKMKLKLVQVLIP